MIQVRNVSKTYYTDFFRRPLPSLKDISFEVAPKQIVGFIGPNGAGKSTLIRMLVGLSQPTSGEILVFGGSPLIPKNRSKMGYLPELPYFYDYLSGGEFLRYMGKLYGLTQKEFDASLKIILEKLEIPELWLNKKLRSFSKGMLQKLGLAQALIHQPSLLILDEPLSGLDPLARQRFREVLEWVHEKGTTLFYSTHVLADLENFCTHTVILNRGELVYQGTVDQWTYQSGFEVELDPSPKLLQWEELNPKVIKENLYYFATESEKNKFLNQALQQNLSIRRVGPAKVDFEKVLSKQLHQHPVSTKT